jgi:hypothetical protein
VALRLHVEIAGQVELGKRSQIGIRTEFSIRAYSDRPHPFQPEGILGNLRHRRARTGGQIDAIDRDGRVILIDIDMIAVASPIRGDVSAETTPGKFARWNGLKGTLTPGF